MRKETTLSDLSSTEFMKAFRRLAEIRRILVAAEDALDIDDAHPVLDSEFRELAEHIGYVIQDLDARVDGL